MLTDCDYSVKRKNSQIVIARPEAIHLSIAHAKKDAKWRPDGGGMVKVKVPRGRRFEYWIYKNVPPHWLSHGPLAWLATKMWQISIILAAPAEVRVKRIFSDGATGHARYNVWSWPHEEGADITCLADELSISEAEIRKEGDASEQRA